MSLLLACTPGKSDQCLPEILHTVKRLNFNLNIHWILHLHNEIVHQILYLN